MCMPEQSSALHIKSSWSYGIKVATPEILICTASIGNKSQALTKTVVTFECKIGNFYHHVCHKLSNALLGKLFLLLPLFITNKDEIYEEKLIVHDRFDAM